MLRAEPIGNKLTPSRPLIRTTLRPTPPAFVMSSRRLGVRLQRSSQPSDTNGIFIRPLQIEFTNQKPYQTATARLPISLNKSTRGTQLFSLKQLESSDCNEQIPRFLWRTRQQPRSSQNFPQVPDGTTIVVMRNATRISQIVGVLHQPAHKPSPPPEKPLDVGELQFDVRRPAVVALA